MVLPVVAVVRALFVTGIQTCVVPVLTWVDADAVLLAGVGSGSLPPMVAVLTMVPAVAGARSEERRVGKACGARGPTPQEKETEALVQVPWGEVAELKPTPEGRVSVTVAPVAASGPLFLAPSV